MGLQGTNSSHQLQPRANGSLGVVLMGLGIPKVDEDTIAHVFRYEAAEALHGLRGAVLVGRNDLAEVLRSIRAESAVEPTRSENITVT